MNCNFRTSQYICYQKGYLEILHSVLSYASVNIIIISNKYTISKYYTGCNRRNGPDLGRVFLMLNYTDKTQNTYIQS